MGTIVAIVSIFLALVAAGCIAYIAWELTAEENHPAPPGEQHPDDRD